MMDTFRDMAVGGEHPGTLFTTDVLARLVASDVTFGSTLVVGNIGADNGRSLLRALQGNTTIRTLIATNAHFGHAGVLILAKGLNQCALSTVMLCEPRLGVESVQTLARALSTNCQLTELSLVHVPVFDLGASMLAQGLASNSTLLILSLQHAGIGEVGARALALVLAARNKTLHSLELGQNRVGSAGLVAMVDAWSSTPPQGGVALGHLGLANNDIRSVGVSYWAMFLLRDRESALWSLDLRDNQFGDTAGLDLLAAIEERVALRRLPLSGNGLCESLVARLDGMRRRNEQLYTCASAVLALYMASSKARNWQPRALRLPAELWDFAVFGSLVHMCAE